MITSMLLVSLAQRRTTFSAGPGEVMTTVTALAASSLMVLHTIRLLGWSEW